MTFPSDGETQVIGERRLTSTTMPSRSVPHRESNGARETMENKMRLDVAEMPLALWQEQHLPSQVFPRIA